MFAAIIDLGPIKHICLVGTNSAPVQGTILLIPGMNANAFTLGSREAASRRMGHGLSWFETALKRLLTMRV